MMVTFLMSGINDLPYQSNLISCVYTQISIQMKIILDTKSLLIGLSAASLAFFTMGTKSQSDSDNGKFQTEIRDNVVLILNTQNGDYMVATDLIDLRRNQWIKGEFYKTFKAAKDTNK